MKPDPGRNEYGNPNAGYPAEELYVGRYNRALKLAAGALTDPSLILIASARHGLVPLRRPLHPYNVTIGDDRAVSARTLAHDAADHGLDDADVLFLGDQEYAALLRPIVPHLFTPLLSDDCGQYELVGGDDALREAWWSEAALLRSDHGDTF
ncbi:DUF6884 domain-containing protein [Streptomyces nanshensis]